MPNEKEPVTDDFAAKYPNISDFVQGNGWVVIGRDEYSRSLVRAINEGGMVWEGKTKYPSMDAALAALEAGIVTWYEEVP